MKILFTSSRLKLSTSVICLFVLMPRLFAQSGGVLRLHPANPHYFLYQNKPALLVGSGEHYGSVINLDFNYKKYLQTIAQAGLNTTRLFMGAYVEKPGDFGIQKNNLAPAEGRLILPWQRSNAAGYALGGNKVDLTRWDEAYFVRLKEFMTEARQKGIIVEITLFSSHYADGWNYSVFNRKNNVNQTDSVAPALVNTQQNGNILKYQEQYVRKLVRELNGFDNVYFEIQNEPWSDQKDTVLIHQDYGTDNDWRSTLEVVSARSSDWQRQVARWIKEEESKLPVKHLISQNISNFHYPITNPDPNVSIFNFHYSSPEAVTENYHLNRVIGFNETGFAGRADATYRRQAWRFLMAGGSLFNHLDYSFWVGNESGTDTVYKAPGGGSPILRQQLGILKRFFDQLTYVSLHPDASVVKAAPGARTQALSDGRSQWIIYLESLAMQPHNLQLSLPKGTYQAEWMDAVTGTPLKTVSVTSGKLTVPAGLNDKVVRIKPVAAKK